jgi:hypothetical protein
MWIARNPCIIFELQTWTSETKNKLMELMLCMEAGKKKTGPGILF